MALTMLAILATQACGASPGPCNPTPAPCHPILVVEVNDASRLPIPGAAVTVKAERGKEGKKRLTTGVDGLAQFCLAGGASYDVRVAVTGFKKRRVRSAPVPVSVHAPAVRIGLELEVAGPFETVE